jgi:protein ImuB
MICCLVRDVAGGEAPQGVLEAVARACSPRVAPHGDEAVVFDVGGLTRAIGAPDAIVYEVQRLAATHGVSVHVAVADRITAAWVLAHARPGCTVVLPGEASRSLAPIPIGWLGTVVTLDRVVGASTASTTPAPERATRSGHRSGRRGHYRVAPAPHEVSPSRPTSLAPVPASDRQVIETYRDRLAILARWGIRTCGALAALPRADVRTRLGRVGVRLHLAASGEDASPLVPVEEARVWREHLALEWPIEGLEPLAFVLGRLCERLSLALERADRGAVVVHTTLTLVSKAVHVRSLTLPAPLRDARVLRTLILLDLESHPPTAGIDAVDVRVEVTPGRILQGSLLSAAVPTPEDLSTLLARVGALMGERRIGAPVCLDTHDARQVALQPFAVRHVGAMLSRPAHPSSALAAWPRPEKTVSAIRRFRLPVAVRVVAEHGVPVRVISPARDLPGGLVVRSAGPWRTSGGWWTDGRTSWDRDEWDVEVADGLVYRVARVRPSGQWELEGVFD